MSVRLCINCLYFMAATGKCGHSDVPDPVRGLPQNNLALLERTLEGDKFCGPEAKFFKLIPLAEAA